MKPPENSAEYFLVEHRERFVLVRAQPGTDLDDARNGGVRHFMDNHVGRAEFPSEEHGRDAAPGRIGKDDGIRGLCRVARFAVEFLRGFVHFTESLVYADGHVMVRV